MKRSVLLVAGAVAFALTAGATDVPKVETYLGYDYLRTNLGSGNLGLLNESVGDIDMNGGSAQFIYNFNKWFSAAVDLGAVNKGNVGVLNVSDRRAFFMAGPRVSYRTSSRFTPFFEVLFGGAERSASKSLSVVTGENTPELPVATPLGLFPGPGVEVTAKLTASQTDFSMVAGGGLDFRVSKRFTFRPIELDWIHTTFPSLLTGNGSSQGGIRASIGFAFTFGAR